MTDDLNHKIRALFVDCLESVTRATTWSDSASSICQLFESLLPEYLLEYSDLVADRIDLERVVTSGIPVVLCGRIHRLLEDKNVRELYPDHVLQLLSCALALLEGRLQDPGEFLDSYPSRETPKEPHEICLLAGLEDVCRAFAARVLIVSPPSTTTSPEERREARERRLQGWFGVRKMQGLPGTFADVCRLAKVPRSGTGSGAMWKNGKLPDTAKTSRRIEEVLNFRKSLVH